MLPSFIPLPKDKALRSWCIKWKNPACFQPLNSITFQYSFLLCLPLWSGSNVSQRAELWTCPDCGHRFVTRNIWHSSGNYDLDEHFSGREPIVREIFDRLEEIVRGFGLVTVYVQKTCIVFRCAPDSQQSCRVIVGWSRRFGQDNAESMQHWNESKCIPTVIMAIFIVWLA